MLCDFIYMQGSEIKSVDKSREEACVCKEREGWEKGLTEGVKS